MSRYDGTLESLFTLPPRAVPSRALVWDPTGKRVDPYAKRPKGKRVRKRDAQRQRVYSAENTAFGGNDSMRDLADLAAAAQLVDRIQRSEWMKKNYPAVARWTRPIRVIGGNGNNANASRIMLTMHGRQRTWIVLHELAHSIASRVYSYTNNNETIAAHGREYANIYLALVRRWMGVAHHDRLRICFKAKRVRHSLPRKSNGVKRPGNPAALAAYRERMRLSARPSEVTE